MTTSDIDATTPKHLAGKYAVVGVGETTYRRGSTESTRNLATWAIKNAMDDAGLTADDVDGMLSYSGGDSTMSNFVAGDLGIRLNFYMDVFGGGSSTEALVGIALLQLTNPGTPVVYGGFTSNVDMRSGSPAFGTPEHFTASLCAGQLARLIDLPWRCASGSAATWVM